MIVHKKIRVSGRVQGVFFRASAADVATSLGLKGFVLNEDTGSVYIEVEGDEGDVKRLIEWAKQGPPRAKVESVDVTDGAILGFKEFEVKRIK